uniref:Glycosyltransferase n=1 Tax=Antirrhinum majus TaxID=4151 RepID=B2NID4_ANTMA|nr:UGT73A9 [Antirrhinum majus]
MGKLHIALFPVMAHGHMIPMLDMAKLFTSRGIQTTIISTLAFADPINKARDSGLDIGLSILKFPPEGSGIPDHMVSLDLVTEDWLPKFVESLVLLQEPVEKLIEELKLDCLVSDMFLPWTVDCAAKFGIPRLVFHGTSNFALCASEQMKLHKPYKNVTSDTETFVIPDFPHELKFVRTQVAPFQLAETENGFSKLMKQMTESVGRSYGVVVNSFYELESTYVDYYREVLGRKSWNIGPLLLSNNGNEEKVQRGKESAIGEHECLAWLNSKKQNSVVYVCFGSMATFTPAQLRETAIGLEESGQEFIWVVKKAKNEEEGKGKEEWLPENFEERVKDRGLIIRGWAPQLLILDHPAVGAFVTHCGWNSTLEGICAGVPMVTWPVFAEQFFNEKFVTEVLGTGVSVGNKKWLRAASEGVSREAVTNAVQRVMVGENASEMRKRAKYYKEMARRAVEEGGSSYNGLNEMIEDLSVYRAPEKQDLN